MSTSNRLIIFDTTLRDGEQAPGAVELGVVERARRVPPQQIAQPAAAAGGADWFDAATMSSAASLF